ncbi:MAG: S1 family peptidase [Myxococcota bacterium]
MSRVGIAFLLLALTAFRPGSGSAGETQVRVPRAESEHFGGARKKRFRRIADADYLKDSVVRIDVKRRGGEFHAGSGFIVCQDERRIFVLTAKHVLSGSGDPNPSGDSAPLAGLRKIEVSFRGGVPASIRSRPEDFAPRWARDTDIALLVFEVESPGGLAVAKPALDARLEVGAPVRTIGYSKTSGQAWFTQDGLIRDEGEFLLFEPATDEGYSGGPVFDAGGRVIAINRSTQQGLFTAATRIDRAFEFANPHLPRSCRR